MARSFNYSKWDNIELSDDESDLHPNIDKDSWFRLKHRTRLEREEKEDQEVKEYNQKTAEDNARLKVIHARIKGIESGTAGEDAEFEDVEALKNEATELETAIAARNKRTHEIQERRKWNIDNICVVKEEKTVVSSGKTTSLKSDVGSLATPSEPETVFTQAESTAKPVETKKPAAASTSAASAPVAKASSAGAAPAAKAEVLTGPQPSTAISREKLSVMSYNDYVIGHEKILEEYSEISDIEATKQYLFKHCDILLHEHAQAYMLLSCLEDEMNGKKKRMKLVCRQSQILSHIQELGVSMKRDPRDVILPFFRRIEEKEYFKGFLSAVEDFVKRIQKRAIEKRREMDQDEGREPHLGPGGLDPYVVLQELPDVLREAFESQDMARLQAVLASMDPLEAKTHMKRCVDSGLWVPADASIYDNPEGGLEEITDDEDEGEGNKKEAVEAEVDSESRVEELP